MIAAGERRIGNAFAVAEQAVGMIHFGALFPLADSHAGFAEKHARKRFCRHAEVLAPCFNGERLFDIFEEMACKFLKLMTAGHDDAHDGAFRSLDDVPDDERHAMVFFLGEIKRPVVYGENKFSEKRSADNDMAGVEAFIILEKRLMNENSPFHPCFKRVEIMSSAGRNPDELSVVGKIVSFRSFDDGTSRLKDNEFRPRRMLMARSPITFRHGAIEWIEKIIFIDKIFILIRRPVVFA